MRKLLPLLLCVPLIFSCGDTDNLQREITKEMLKDGYTGKGTVTYANGDKYVGEYKDGKKDGQGTNTDADGSKYVGEWKNSLYHGQGTYTDASLLNKGDKYVGEFKNDKKHGQGTYTTKSGDKYVGEFKDDKRNGQGTYTDINGGTYIGEFEDNKRNGQGTYTTKSGDKYVGEFKDDKRNGRGFLISSIGDKYEGEWNDGNYNGQGIYTTSNGDEYIGQWKGRNFLHSQGTYTYMDVSLKGLWTKEQFLGQIDTRPIHIGDYRYGGIVFYIDSTRHHGLVCDLNELGEGTQWGCVGKDIEGADGTDIGTGLQNTIDILAECTTPGIAAALCSNSNAQGYTDWFLPSKDELLHMYQNKDVIDLAVISNEGVALDHFYWSSSEVNITNASAFYEKERKEKGHYYRFKPEAYNSVWVHQFFFDGSQDVTNKSVTCDVRAVRAF